MHAYVEVMLVLSLLKLTKVSVSHPCALEAQRPSAMPAKVVDGGQKRGVSRAGTGPTRPQPLSRGAPSGNQPAANSASQAARGVDPRTQVKLLCSMLGVGLVILSRRMQQERGQHQDDELMLHVHRVYYLVTMWIEHTHNPRYRNMLPLEAPASSFVPPGLRLAPSHALVTCIIQAAPLGAGVPGGQRSAVGATAAPAHSGALPPPPPPAAGWGQQRPTPPAVPTPAFAPVDPLNAPSALNRAHCSASSCFRGKALREHGEGSNIAAFFSKFRPTPVYVQISVAKS